APADKPGNRQAAISAAASAILVHKGGRMCTRIALAAAVIAACLFPGLSAGAAERVHCWRPGPNREKCRISEPNVTQATTSYPQVHLRYGDRVRIDAGGCVQTGGSGRTWKLYVDPRGPNSNEFYYGLVYLPGFGIDFDSN